MKAQTILILCFLGDPTLPAGSLAGTGGFNASVKDLLDFLKKNDSFNCIFITNTTGNYTKTSTIKVCPNVTLYRVYSTSIHLLKKNDYTKDIKNFENSIEQIIQDFSNIAFIHSFYWLSGLIAASLSEKHRIPFIHTTVSLSKQKLLSNYEPGIVHQFDYEYVFLNKAKYILAITEEEKRILEKYYNINSKKIIVEGQTVTIDYHQPIYDNYGIPQTIAQSGTPLKPVGFDELNVSEGNWWNYGAFTYVGRVTKTKGVDIIIKAWIELDKQFNGAIPPLWIIGNSPYEIDGFRNTLDISLKSLCKYEKAKRIVWWGYLTPAAISTLYLKTAVLITHSRFEGGGRVILEALCQGIPAISTNTGFGKDYIINWLNGFIVNYGDIKALTLRMSHFVASPVLSSVLGENAKNIFNKMETNWNHNACIKNLYNALIDNSSFSNKCTSNITLDEDVFEKGIVTTYPYYYRKPTLKNIADFTNSCIKEKLFSPEKFLEISSSNIWVYNKQYVVKNIYPKLNKRKLWDYSEKTAVWNTHDIIEKIIVSTKSMVVLNPLNISREDLLVMLPYMEILSCTDIEKNLCNVASHLELFSESSIITDDKYSFVSYWKNLLKNINALNITELTQLLGKITPSIKYFLTDSDNFTGNICIQYAQLPLGHIGIFEKDIFLLPTYHWKYAQQGLDAGLLLYQILLSEPYYCSTITLATLECFATIWHIGKKQILAWALYICLENMICDLIFHDSKQSSIYFQIIALFDQLI